MSADKFEVVERPVDQRGKSGRILDPMSLAGQLRATAETGKAIRLPRGSRAQYIHGLLKKQGYRLYTRTDGDFVICWCVKIEKETDGEHSQ